MRPIRRAASTILRTNRVSNPLLVSFGSMGYPRVGALCYLMQEAPANGLGIISCEQLIAQGESAGMRVRNRSQAGRHSVIHAAVSLGPVIVGAARGDIVEKSSTISQRRLRSELLHPPTR